jgi:hypothetical protein
MKRGSKKGQVTIFIIIAIVIVAAIAAVIIIQRTQEGPSAEVRVIKNYLDSCFEEKAEETILETAKRGFYYELPVASISFLGEETAYYFKDSQKLVPSVTEIEQELSSLMDRKISSCLVLNEFREEYDISFEECLTTASINENNVGFSFSCPITISKGITTSTLDSFQVNINCNAQKLINASNFIVEEYSIKPGYICLECFDEIAKANGITINVIPITSEVFEPEHTWFILTDKEKQIDNQNLILRFVTD